MKSYNKKLRIVETDVLILGAGLTGLSTAYHLGGREYCVLEKENRPGGLCGSVSHNGFLYDYTGHLLHLRNEYAKELIFSFLKNNLTYRTRNTLIHSFGRYTRYPFQANLFGLPKQIIEECIKGLVESKLKYFTCDRKKMDMSFRDWCVMTFGQGISKYFMIPYNENLNFYRLHEI